LWSQARQRCQQFSGSGVSRQLERQNTPTSGLS
jgi:hypothetical protein